MYVYDKLNTKKRKKKEEEPLRSNQTTAVIFNQLDNLSLPGAGLRHLDFQSEMPSIFQGLFTNDGTQSHMQVPPISPPLSTTDSYVRTYGSEPEMYVFLFVQP